MSASRLKLQHMASKVFSGIRSFSRLFPTPTTPRVDTEARLSSGDAETRHAAPAEGRTDSSQKEEASAAAADELQRQQQQQQQQQQLQLLYAAEPEPRKRERNHLGAGLTAGVITAVMTHVYDGHAGRFARSSGYLSGVQGGLALFRHGFNFGAFHRTLHVVGPSVGLYFTVYEYMKNNVFVVDDPHRHRSAQVAAWMSSAFCGAFVGHMLAKPTMLIPFRYAVQFGVFEYAKDVARWTGRNRDTDKPRHLGPLAIMSTAAAGGIAAHAFVFPMTHLQHAFRKTAAATAAARAPLAVAGPVAAALNPSATSAATAAAAPASLFARLAATLRETPPRALYRGWGGACVRFLPPCVVTASSYEFMLRAIVRRGEEDCEA